MSDRDHPLYQRLPAVVANLAERSGARVSGGSFVRLDQTGRMRAAASAPWMRFTARQTIALDHAGFAWTARTGPCGVITVRDALIEGTGRLDVRALGLVRLAGVGRSAELTRGECMRYLAELPWAPDAILRNQALRWRVADPDTLVVGMGEGEAAVEITLTLGPDGRIAGAYAPDRGALIKGVSIRTPWRGTFTDYRRHDGVWIPFSGEVSWDGPHGEWVYWQGKIEQWTRMPSGPTIRG